MRRTIINRRCIVVLIRNYPSIFMDGTRTLTRMGSLSLCNDRLYSRAAIEPERTSRNDFVQAVVSLDFKDKAGEAVIEEVDII